MSFNPKSLPRNRRRPIPAQRRIVQQTSEDEAQAYADAQGQGDY